MKAKITILIIICICMFCSNVNGVEYENNINQITQKDYLVTLGSKIVKKSNNEALTLKGINLGGWLLQTVYMSPITINAEEGKVGSMTDVMNELYGRFGENFAKQLLNTYWDNYITSEDLDEIAKTGANVVRVPFWWRNLMNEDGSFIYNDEGNVDFKYFDWIVDECSKRGMYVIFALHGAPGAQSPNNHATGIEIENPTLFLYGEQDVNGEGEKNRRLTASLWTMIARHYNENPTIAGYDILGEPWGGPLSSNHGLVWNFYEYMYKAIRIVDSEHIIFMESCWNLEEIGEAYKNKNFKNVVYSTHDYPTKENIAKIVENTEESKQMLRDFFTSTISKHQLAQETYNIPIYVGELSCYDYWDIGKYACDLYESNNISYTFWSYKLPENTRYGVMYRTLKADSEKYKANISNDSFDEIKAKWSIKTKDIMFLKNEGRDFLIQQFGGRIAQKVTLDKSTLSLYEGETGSIKASVIPENAINKNIVWLSSNSNVASVDINGTITAKRAGIVYIVAKAEENLEIKASCKVTVLPVKVENIILNKTQLKLIEGLTETLILKIIPSNATNQTVIWKSDDETIATVDSTGKITAIKEGKTIITVTSEDGEKTATCNINVEKEIEKGDINKDSQITATDLLKVKRHIVGIKILLDEERVIADMNNDGKITATDVLKIKKKIIGLD